MLKKSLTLSLLFALAMVYAFAEQEQLTITTYYPSPYGSYNQLEVHRGITYKPLTNLPNTDYREGELVYVDSNPGDSTPGEFYYYGGGRWVAQGGGGAVISLKCASCSSPGRGEVANAVPFGCTPPSCPSGWTPLSTGCAYTSTYEHTYGPGFCGYCEQWCYKQ